MSVVLAIDPGPTRSAWVLFDAAADRIVEFCNGQPNEEVVAMLAPGNSAMDQLVIERIQSYGRSVGAPVFETAFWSGRFAQAAEDVPLERIANPTVRAHLCGRTGVGYPEVKSALYDRFGGVEGRAKAVGVKKAQGPLYGFTGDDVYAALALAVTWADKNA
jgi:hypothetical protein